MTTHDKLMEIYQLLYDKFGPQNWWPIMPYDGRDTRDENQQAKIEIITGAILTQNTSWTNVEKAIKNLKETNNLSTEKLYQLETPQLALLIKSAGYYNIKANRLKNFINWLYENYDGDLSNLESLDTDSFRTELLSIKGIGRETADSILLYAYNRPIFVIDAYTARITVRHELVEPGADYEQLRDFFESNLPQDVKLYNEFHALLVRLGNEFCKPKPKCPDCPLEQLPHKLDIEYF